MQQQCSWFCLPPRSLSYPSEATPTDWRLPQQDWEAEVVPAPDTIQADGTAGILDDDPLGLVPKLPFVQRYSLDTDHWEVWLCGNTGYTMNGAIADLEAATSRLLRRSIRGQVSAQLLSRRHQHRPVLHQRSRSGNISTVGSPEGVIVVDSVTGGGFASPGLVCSDDRTGDCTWIDDKFPGNGRYAVVGGSALAGWGSVATHEIGHTIQWPHSNSGIGDDYDNPIDLMSGNMTTTDYTEPLPYGTAAFNRYQAGWIDPGDVYIAGGASQQLSLQPFDRDGLQMIVCLTSKTGLFYTLGARSSSTVRPDPAAVGRCRGLQDRP